MEWWSIDNPNPSPLRYSFDFLLIPGSGGSFSRSQFEPFDVASTYRCEYKVSSEVPDAMAQLTIHLTVQTDESISVTGQVADRDVEQRVSQQAAQEVLQQAASMIRGFGADQQARLQLGATLANVFLKPFLEATLALAGSEKGQLLICSEDLEYLRLPWELLPGPENRCLVAGGRWRILRSARASLLPRASGLPAPPLRILFCACAPTDLPPIEFEQEEEAMLRFASELRDRVHLEIVETGAFEDVARHISELKPQIVHLAGHTILKGRMGHFVFENDRGLSDVRPVPEIAGALFFEKGVRLLYLTDLSSAHAGALALCHSLTATNHVPTAVAWSGRISEGEGAAFTRGFYQRLAQAEPVDSAACAAFCDLPQGPPTDAEGKSRIDSSFGWPQVFAAAEEVTLVDPMRKAERPIRPPVRYHLLEDNICGLHDGFVGRRRVLQRTRTGLRDGVKRLLLLTGIGGSGKSTLATRLASFLQKDGFQIVAVQARKNDASQFCLRLLGKLAVACRQIGRAEDEKTLNDGQRPVAERLRLAVGILNQAKVLLVLDTLEELRPAPPAASAWTDPEFGGFCQELVNRLNGEGRAVLTCNHRPADLDPNHPNLAHEELPGFTAADFLKYVRRDEEVANRIERGQLSHDLVVALHRKLGITPRFVKQACAVLARTDALTLSTMIGSVVDGLSPEQQQARFREVFLPHLYGSLRPDFRIGLSRVALVEIPLPLDGVARVSGLGEREAEKATADWFALGLVLQFGGENKVRLFAVHPLQREFFLANDRLPADQAKAAHLAAAAFFQDCFELNREEELRTSVAVELLACLQHAAACGDNTLRHWAAVRLSRQFQGTAEYSAAKGIIEPLLRNDKA